MATAFNTTVAALEDELTQLILEGLINARIDSHSKVVPHGEGSPHGEAVPGEAGSQHGGFHAEGSPVVPHSEVAPVARWGMEPGGSGCLAR